VVFLRVRSRFGLAALATGLFVELVADGLTAGG
jgi:hypothetical protein